MGFLSSKTQVRVSVVFITCNKLASVLIIQGKTYGEANISAELHIFVQVRPLFLKGDRAYAQVFVEKCVLWQL